MHSCDTLPAPATGTNLLLQLGRLIIRSRSASPARGSPQDPHDAILQAKLRAAKPHTSRQIPYQFPPKLDPERPVLEAKLDDHVQALWNEHIPVCIEVFLAPDCAECHSSFVRENEDRPSRALLLERWTMQALVCKNHESRAFITSQWLLNAVRSQLHFSQLAAWLARLKTEQDDSNERRRKLSREKCNYKKVEANCDDDLGDRKLNIVYSIKIPGETYKMAEFSRTPTDHTFPVTDIGNNVYLKVVLQSLPRIDDIPTLKCMCKRRASKDMSNQEELVAKLNDLTLGTRPKFPEDSINSNIGNSSRRLSIVSNSGSTEYLFTSAPDKKDRLLDDRMHTTCSENGKHKCNCDDESDGKENQRSSTSVVKQDKLKEMAKHKRRMRKEYKLKQSDSTSSEGDVQKKEYTSIPILQAAKFDRFRAIGYYRNQTYLTLPASRIEVKTPFEPPLPPAEFKKTNSVSTQTEDFLCNCGNPLDLKCGDCKGMVRSEANYNLASLNGAEINDSPDDQKTENGARRKSEENGNSHKKQKCDNINKKNCDISLDNVNSIIEGRDEEIIKKPKLRRFFFVEDRIDRVVSDRNTPKDHDVKELNLNMDDTVFSEMKRPVDNSFSEVKRPVDNDSFSEVKRPIDNIFSEMKRPIDNIFSESKRLEENFSEVNKQDDNLELKIPDEKIEVKRTDEDLLELKRPNQDVKRQKTFSVSDDDYILYEKCDYGTIDRCDMESPKDDHPPDMNGFQFPDPEVNKTPPEESPPPMGFPWTLDPSSSMVFTKTGLPLNSSPAPLRKGNCFDFDKSISSVSGIRSALFQPITTAGPSAPPVETKENIPRSITPRPTRPRVNRPKHTALLGSFEESCLKGRLDPVATVEGFTAEIGASGSFCPPHKRFPVTVYFFAPGGTNAPYMGHVALPGGYRVPRAGSVQLALFNPAGALVRVWVVRHDLRRLPPRANTFLRQRTLRAAPGEDHTPAALRYLIHLRFMTSKSGKLYLHTDIRIIVSRKADFDTATAHCAIYRPVTTNQKSESADNSNGVGVSANEKAGNRAPNRVFGGCGDADSSGLTDIGYENDNVAYELKSFTYAPDNPKYSPR